jgi:hypothetical protein
MRERLHVLLICVTFFVGRIILDFVTNGIFVFGCGIFFHCYRFPEVDRSSVEDSRARALVRYDLHTRTIPSTCLMMC